MLCRADTIPNASRKSDVIELRESQQFIVRLKILSIFEKTPQREEIRTCVAEIF
jgi:hypothetical protein